MEIDELIKRAKKKNNTDEEWLRLESDMQTFLDEEHPEEEKRKLVPLGWKESVTIICDGIRRKMNDTTQ